ncbi:hypothetical protein [Paenirhodobacter hankyongi]|uniref:hypothetical protein n=1 Tax=Paenirhodobacter hankyongi TaxID=2294033 RepID=UPI0011C34476|nr:hypothetical protein [Sinirhodobacter hankyongi]
MSKNTTVLAFPMPAAPRARRNLCHVQEAYRLAELIAAPRDAAEAERARADLDALLATLADPA